MRKHFFKYIIILLITVIVAFSGFSIYENTLKVSIYSDDLVLEYFEDFSGKMELEQVQKKFMQGEYTLNEGDAFSFGKSASTYWIRIPLGEISPQADKQYISIYNPTVTKVILYLPALENGEPVYKALSSGWGFGENKQDERFLYPVFRLDQNTDFSKDAYIQLYSDYTQNYRIIFQSHDEFNQTMQESMLLRYSFLGILIAVALQNLITFIVLKNRSNLYHFFYILAMILYQGCLLGIFNTFLPAYSKWIMGNTLTLALITISTIVALTRDYFKTKKCFPSYDRILKGLMILTLADVILIIAKQPVLANLYGHSIANIDFLFIMLVAFHSYKKGFEQAGIFILSWAFILVSSVISLLRHLGWVSNNVITLNIILFAAAIQAILLSVALVKMVKIITQEKEQALRQFKAAEESAASHEIAFLHAQIKPHFLYNALNVIISLCRIDSEKARTLLMDLSEFLRYSFVFREEQKLVALKDELEYVKTYVRIEQARFRNKLKVLYELDIMTEPKIPPLLLQPLVENAIIHGVRKRNGIGTIILRVIEEDICFKIEVEDDGLGMTKEQIDRVINRHKGRGIGITNINKRLERIYGQGLEIESVQGEGTIISFKVSKGGLYHAEGNVDR